ncbi:MAG: hypothetical protein NT090_18945, partial [Acidobacteria bacterium]|nr:hypothetical protein [Acidobacteriota bacterium]
MMRIARAVCVGVLMGICACAAGVKVDFDPLRPEVGPFPTDYLTAPDAAQKTGLRVNLPLSNCAADPATCLEIGLLNELDGFSIFPRLRVRFTGAVNPDTLRDGLFVVWLDKLTNDEWGLFPAGHVTAVNEVLWDPKTNTAFAKPDEFLAQTRRYALVVTDKVRDAGGAPVEAAEGFTLCLAKQLGGTYCEQLAGAVQAHEPLLGGARIVGGSVFTTLSATAWMQRAREQLQTTATGVKAAAPKSVFEVAQITSIKVRPQTKTKPAQFDEKELPLAALAGVGRIGFGSFRSPLWLNQMLLIPGTPTAAPVRLPETLQEIQFEVFLPAAPAPPGGYPVVIVGHFMPGDRFGLPLAMAATLAARGFATIAITTFGSGQGPEGKVVIAEKGGVVTELPLGGRSVDVDGNGAFDEFQEGCVSGVGLRDCARQNALDHLQLVRVIQAGLDLNGDGAPDLDRNRISFAGVSLGGITGAILLSVEPAIQAAVLNGTLGPNAYHWTRTLRPLVIGMLAKMHPALLNRGMDYDSDYVERFQPAKTITVAGAVDLQEWIERTEWISMSGAAEAWAPHLWWTTLPGIPVKRTLLQFALGEGVVPAPSLSAVARAANLREMTSIYRHDLAVKMLPELAATEAHYYLAPMGPAAQMAIAVAAQTQAAEFLASGAWTVPDVNGALIPLFGRA